MFEGCKNLEYINLKNAVEKEELNYTNIFEGIPENIVICLNETNTPNLTMLIKNKTCYNIYCNNDWRQNKKDFVNKTEKCENSCNDTYEYIHEYNNKCHISCLCISCNENFYRKENDITDKEPYFNCYNNNLDGYYLDNDDNNNKIYKLML
jgi:hypothetical protein